MRSLYYQLSVLSIKISHLVVKPDSLRRRKGPSTEELTKAFRQAKEQMFRTGQLPTVKALVERYVHKVIVTDKNIKVQFKFNLSSRVIIYPVDLSHQKEIPQPSDQSITEVFTFVPTKMLATGGGAFYPKGEPFDGGSIWVCDCNFALINPHQA